MSYETQKLRNNGNDMPPAGAVQSVQRVNIKRGYIYGSMWGTRMTTCAINRAFWRIGGLEPRAQGVHINMDIQTFCVHPIMNPLHLNNGSNKRGSLLDAVCIRTCVRVSSKAPTNFQKKKFLFLGRWGPDLCSRSRKSLGQSVLEPLKPRTGEARLI